MTPGKTFSCFASKLKTWLISYLKFPQLLEFIIMVLVVLILVASVVASPGGNSEEPATKQLAVFENPNLPAAFSSSTTSGFLQRRDVPEALIDPYSVLGVLSFGVYIFYILYHRYQTGMGSLKHQMGQNLGNPGSPEQQNPPTQSLFNMGSEQNLAYLLEMASKILSNAAKVGGTSFNGTAPLLETLDYYDETTDLQTPS